MGLFAFLFSMRGWPIGQATAFQAVQAGSIPAPRSNSARPLDAPLAVRRLPGLRAALADFFLRDRVNAVGGAHEDSGEAREGRGASPGVEAPGDCFPHLLLVDSFHAAGGTPPGKGRLAGKSRAFTRVRIAPVREGARATRWPAEDVQ